MASWAVEAEILIRGLAGDVAGLAGRIDGFEVRVENGWQVSTCPGLPHPPFSAIMTSHPDADERLATAIPGLVSRFDSLGLAPAVLLAHRAFPAAEAAAQRAGLTELEELPGMVVRPHELAAAPPVEAVLRRISPSADDRARFSAVAIAGFGIPPAAAELIVSEPMMAGDQVAYHLAETADGPACCAITFTAGAATGVYLVGTVPDQRRRGLAAALVRQAVSEAFAQGAEIAYLQSSTMGHSVYRSLGFRDVSHELRLRRPRVTREPASRPGSAAAARSRSGADRVWQASSPPAARTPR